MKKGILVIVVSIILVSGCVEDKDEPQPSALSTPTPTYSPKPTQEPTLTPATHEDENALELHKKGWVTILEKSRTDFYCKYSFYTSRILAVHHPEIYLKSDLIKAQSFPLHITLEKLQSYKIIGFKEIYPAEYPVFSMLDRRNFPLFLTMHSESKVITQVDMASAYYAMLRQNNAEAHTMYIIYCDNENSYVYHEGQIMFMKNLQSVESIQGNPILIFNENHAWFPLLGRNRISNDPSAATLQNMVEKFSTEDVTPELSEFEEKIIGEVNEITQDINKDIALQLTEYSWYDDPPSITFPYSRIHCALMLKLADYLSPVPAYLATVDSQSQGITRIQAIGDEFLKHISVHNYLETPGDETDNTADSSYYTGIAACGPKSFPVSVALDFMGVENYVVSGMDIEKSGHFWVYVKEYDLIINNAHVSKQKGFVHGEGRFKLINYIGYKMEGLSFFWENNEFEVHGNLNPEIVIELLQYVQKEYGTEIGGLHHVDGQRQMVSLQELIETLKAH
jgi:hypothetical protein